ncbi:MAG TPA: type II toxin-antitoxin system VapC family toxin [Gemmatimonadaceae bacterium]|nr:type II toxin-antitoxin system VapC family toxin [Gemmatimonadaceae bacterium]
MAPDAPAPFEAGVASIRYVETSALLAALLEQDTSAKHALRVPARRLTSALTGAEAHRAIIRAQATGRLDATQLRLVARAVHTFLARCDLVAVTDEVLARVGRPFPMEPIRTLDAIHLATAELLGGPPALITIVTRDARVRENALRMGYHVA